VRLRVFNISDLEAKAELHLWRSATSLYQNFYENSLLEAKKLME